MSDTGPALGDDETIEVAQLAIRKAKLREEKAALDEQIAAVDARLRDLLPDGTTAAGDLKIIVSTPARLDTTALTDAFPVAQHPELYRPVIDVAAVREHMSPVQLRVFTVFGARTVTVR